MKLFCVLSVMFVLMSCHLEHPENNETNTGKLRTAMPAIWYVHLQRYFEPYSESHIPLIEKDYEKYLQDHSKNKSNEFNINNSCYYINFSLMRQTGCNDENIYRTVRRIRFDNTLTKNEMTMRIPLTYEQIIQVGGHPENYLTSEELALKRVSGQERADFFPIKAKVIEDSLNS